MKTMIAFMIPAPNKQKYIDIQKKIHEEFGGKPLTMAPHITLKVPCMLEPEAVTEMFKDFTHGNFVIERNQFYRFGDYVAYDGIIKNHLWNRLANHINTVLGANGVKLKADDRDRVPHITIAKAKGKGRYNLPAFQISQKLNTVHHDFKPIKVNNFTICKKTDNGWKKHANIILS